VYLTAYAAIVNEGAGFDVCAVVPLAVVESYVVVASSIKYKEGAESEYLATHKLTYSTSLNEYLFF